MELLIMIDALKRASAGRITAGMPYYGYARQDRKDRPRVAITAKLIADLLSTAGANRALLVDLHAAQIQGFFNIPVDHMFASPVLVGHFRDLNLPDLTVVSPDAGGVERARHVAKKLEVPLAIVDKRRTDVNVAEVMNVIGDVEACVAGGAGAACPCGGAARPVLPQAATSMHAAPEIAVTASQPRRLGRCHRVASRLRRPESRSGRPYALSLSRTLILQLLIREFAGPLVDHLRARRRISAQEEEAASPPGPGSPGAGSLSGEAPTIETDRARRWLPSNSISTGRYG